MKKYSIIFISLLVIAFGSLYGYINNNYAFYGTISMVLVMLILWISNVIPLGATALIPLVLLPFYGVIDLKTVASNYGNQNIFLFLGGFLLAIMFEKWNIHKRFSLFILSKVGTNPNQILAGFMIATASLSMWISNTATTLLMVQLAMSVFLSLEEKFDKYSAKIKMGILFGIAFSANIGGIATLIGTPPNIVLLNYFEEELNITLSFFDWLIMGIPLSSLLLIFTYFTLNYFFLKDIPKNIHLDKNDIEKERKSLGPLSIHEKYGIIIFTLTAFFWILRVPLNNLIFKHLSDPQIALTSALLLFTIRPKGIPLLNWEDTKKLPWDILLLFGGGLAMAAGMQSAGVLDALVGYLNVLEIKDMFIWILILVIISVFATELMSNLALVSALIPIVISFAVAKGFSVYELAIPVAIGASCAFMMPIATPPNAIVYSTKTFQFKDMMKVGFVINIFSIITITIITKYLVPIIFN